MKTYDQIIIEAIKENQPITLKELKKKLDYSENSRIWHMINRLVQNGMLNKNTKRKPYKFSIKEC